MMYVQHEASEIKSMGERERQVLVPPSVKSRQILLPLNLVLPLRCPGCWRSQYLVSRGWGRVCCVVLWSIPMEGKVPS